MLIPLFNNFANTLYILCSRAAAAAAAAQLRLCAVSALSSDTAQREREAHIYNARFYRRAIDRICLIFARFFFFFFFNIGFDALKLICLQLLALFTLKRIYTACGFNVDWYVCEVEKNRWNNETLFESSSSSNSGYLGLTVRYCYIMLIAHCDVYSSRIGRGSAVHTNGERAAAVQCTARARIYILSDQSLRSRATLDMLILLCSTIILPFARRNYYLLRIVSLLCHRKG